MIIFLDMKIKDLKPNTLNPRKITDKKMAKLKASLEKFGDLGCIVVNRRTGNLISGHQRAKSLPPNSQIKIEKTYDTPTKTNTVSEGIVEIGQENFKYREVDVDEKTEMEMLLASNKHGGNWDEEALKISIKNFPTLDLELSGFELDELPSLKKVEPISYQGSDEKSDRKYMKENPGPNTEATKEKLPSTVNYGPKTKTPAEQKEVIGKKNVVIVELPTPKKRLEFKKQIEKIVKKNGGKFI